MDMKCLHFHSSDVKLFTHLTSNTAATLLSNLSYSPSPST